jgi:hypothetical protein
MDDWAIEYILRLLEQRDRLAPPQHRASTGAPAQHVDSTEAPPGTELPQKPVVE